MRNQEGTDLALVPSGELRPFSPTMPHIGFEPSQLIPFTPAVVGVMALMKRTMVVRSERLNEESMVVVGLCLACVDVLEVWFNEKGCT